MKPKWRLCSKCGKLFLTWFRFYLIFPTCQECKDKESKELKETKQESSPPNGNNNKSMTGFEWTFLIFFCGILLFLFWLIWKNYKE